MIALTTRLNERDEAISQLQEELDAYDKIHKEAEVSMDYWRKRVGVLENDYKIRGIEIPKEGFEQKKKMNKDQRETVKLGEFETFNINYKNLSSAGGIIEELKEIADEREKKIY